MYVADPFQTLLLEDQSSEAFLESNSTVSWFFLKELHLSPKKSGIYPREIHGHKVVHTAEQWNKWGNIHAIEGYAAVKQIKYIFMCLSGNIFHTYC